MSLKCNHQGDNPLYVWPDAWSGDLQVSKKYGHTWHQMSSLTPGVIKQHKPNPYYDLTLYNMLTQTHKMQISLRNAVLLDFISIDHCAIYNFSDYKQRWKACVWSGIQWKDNNVHARTDSYKDLQENDGYVISTWVWTH